MTKLSSTAQEPRRSERFCFRSPVRPTTISLLLFFPLCLSTALLTSCDNKPAKPTALIAPGPAKDGSPTVATVGETPISLNSLQVIAAQNGYNLADPEQAKLALRDAVNLELLAAEAKKRGYHEDPDIVRYVKSQSVQKLLLDTVDAPGHQPAQPTDSELRDYYDKHPAEFTSPTLLRAQILALLRRSGREDEFQQKLVAVKAAIAAKELPFSELVTRFSDDPAAKNYGGLTNWLAVGEESKQYPPALIDAVSVLDDTTKVVGPIEHNDWVYFARVAERRAGVNTPFEQAKAGIATRIHRAKRLEAYDRYVSQLGDSAVVTTFPDVVAEALKAATSETSGPPMGPVSVPTK
jgi:peptidyl-prolyl cis-trans isomerase C